MFASSPSRNPCWGGTQQAHLGSRTKLGRFVTPASAGNHAEEVEPKDDGGPQAAVQLPLPLPQAAPSPAATAAAAAKAKRAPPALLEMDASELAAGPATLERWAWAYQQMVADARQLGIPASAIPALPPQPTAAQLRAARDQLSGMIASFLSAGL